MRFDLELCGEGEKCMKGNESFFVEDRSTDVAALSYEESMLVPYSRLFLSSFPSSAPIPDLLLSDVSISNNSCSCRTVFAVNYSLANDMMVRECVLERKYLCPLIYSSSFLLGRVCQMERPVSTSAIQ